MAQKVVDAIKAEGGRAVANGADISTMAGGQSVFDDAIKHFGRADILVNNAGILLDQTFAKATEAAWDKVLKVHLKGTFCCTQPVFRWMRENGGGVIVNTASTSGLIGNFGQTNYGAAKGGIWGLSNVLAIEGRKYNIRIWTVAPGALTRMTADLPRYIENPGRARTGRHRAGRAIHGQRPLGRPDRQGAGRLRPARRARDADDGKAGLEAAACGMEGRRMWSNTPGDFLLRGRDQDGRAAVLTSPSHSGARRSEAKPGIHNHESGLWIHGPAPSGASRNDESDRKIEAHMTKLTHKAAGTFAIAPTPFHDDGRIDDKSIDRLTDFYAEVGCDGVTVLGILGEAPKLDGAEAEQVATRFVKRAKNMQIIVGVSAPGFAAMRSLARASMDAGAAGVMIAPPPICAPTTRSSAISSRRSKRSATTFPGCCRIIR
jgi:NAD(P)-dependent dehydrogenase (short-subunit alcohol dehydrogenase family)